MNASKRARNATSISNKTNTCGGQGKAGTPTTIGRRARTGGRAAPPPVYYACPANPGLFDKSLNAVNGAVVADRNSRFLYTKHIPSWVHSNEVFYLPITKNPLAGGVRKVRS